LLIVVIISKFNKKLRDRYRPEVRAISLPKEKDMKLLKSLIAASALAFSLSLTALAGDMQGPGIVQPNTEPGATQAPGSATTEQPSESDAITIAAISMINLFASIR